MVGDMCVRGMVVVVSVVGWLRGVVGGVRIWGVLYGEMRRWGWNVRELMIVN